MNIEPTAGRSFYSERVCEVLTLEGWKPVFCMFEYSTGLLHVIASDLTDKDTLRIRFQEHVYKCEKKASKFSGMVSLLPVGIVA